MIKRERDSGTGNGKWEREQDFGEREVGAGNGLNRIES